VAETNPWDKKVKTIEQRAGNVLKCGTKIGHQKNS
jgi:hypothetical protein